MSIFNVSTQVTINQSNSTTGPGAAVFNSQIYVFYVPSSETPGQPVTVMVSSDAVKWQLGTSPAGASSSEAPALIPLVASNSLHMVYKGVSGDPRLWTTNMNIKGAWGNAVPMPNAMTSDAAPTGALQNNNTMWVVAKDFALSSISFASSPMNQGWSVPQQIDGLLTMQAPAAIAYNNQVWVFAALPDIGEIKGRSTQDGSSWSSVNFPLAAFTGFAPAAVVLGTTLYVFYVGPAGEIHVAWTSGDGAWMSELIEPGLMSSSAPAAVVWNKSILLFFRGLTDTAIQYVTLTPSAS